MTELLQMLNSIHPLNDGLQNYLSEHLVRIEIPKKDFILKKGHICFNIYFIQKGLARCFYIKDDKEISSWFMNEGDVIVSVESFFKQVVSYESIQALEDCEMYYLSYADLQNAYQNFIEFNVTGRVLTEKYYMLSEQRLKQLRMQTSLEKYHDLIENNPQLIQRVPSKHLASYLGITEEHLSRIRAQR